MNCSPSRRDLTHLFTHEGTLQPPIAATNWHSTWVAFTLNSGAAQTPVANQAQATFHQWVLVCIASLFVAMTALAWLMLAHSGRKNSYPIPAE